MTLCFSLAKCLDIVDCLGVQVVPYITLLVVPVLGGMTDQNLAVQMMASQTFATLIKLMPLEVRLSCICIYPNSSATPVNDCERAIKVYQRSRQIHHSR